MRLGNTEVQGLAIPEQHHFFSCPEWDNDPLVSESHSSTLRFLFPIFNLFGKEVEAQRAGRLVKIDILALTLIASHKQLVA